eukprot:Opistho-2@26112
MSRANDQRLSASSAGNAHRTLSKRIRNTSPFESSQTSDSLRIISGHIHDDDDSSEDGYPADGLYSSASASRLISTQRNAGALPQVHVSVNVDADSPHGGGIEKSNRLRGFASPASGSATSGRASSRKTLSASQAAAAPGDLYGEPASVDWTRDSSSPIKFSDASSYAMPSRGQKVPIPRHVGLNVLDGDTDASATEERAAALGSILGVTADHGYSGGARRGSTATGNYASAKAIGGQLSRNKSTRASAKRKGSVADAIGGSVQDIHGAASGDKAPVAPDNAAAVPRGGSAAAIDSTVTVVVRHTAEYVTKVNISRHLEWAKQYRIFIELMLPVVTAMITMGKFGLV